MTTMEETKIVKFYDNEKYEYPLIEVYSHKLEELKSLLKKYQKNEEYNIDDFLIMLDEKNIIVKNIIIDEELFF